MVNLEYANAYSEVLEILKLLGTTVAVKIMIDKIQCYCAKHRSCIYIYIS